MLQLDYYGATIDRRGQDRLLGAPQYHIFGVFDGVGGNAGGEIAAEIAADHVQEYYRRIGRAAMAPQRPESHESYAKSALEFADRAIRKRQLAQPDLGKMATTAAIGNIYVYGQRYRMTWASVGDSRIHVLRNERIYQLPDDEGYGNVIWNSLGRPQGMTVEQVGTVGLEYDDRVMFCTDGITGDTEEQFLTEAELVEALSLRYTPEKAVRNLFDISRKPDDKSAIVIQISW